MEKLFNVDELTHQYDFTMITNHNGLWYVFDYNKKLLDVFTSFEEADEFAFTYQMGQEVLL